MDKKEMLLKECECRLAANFSGEEIAHIIGQISIVLKRFTVETCSNELAIPDTQVNITLLNMFIVSKKVEGLSERTLKHYKTEIRKALTMIQKPIPEITTNDVRAYIAHKAVDDKVSEVTQNNILRCLSSFFGWLHDEEYIGRNPTKKIKKIKEPKRIKEPIEDLDIERMRNKITNKRDRALFEFLLSTGCRVSEVVGCNIEDLNEDSVIVTGKGNKQREVYLNPRARVALSEYLEERDDQNNALFVSRLSPHNRLKVSGIEIMIRNLGKSAGVKKTHPHRMRRTMATQAINKGMPLEVIQQTLGHESMDTTQIYAQTSRENVKNAHKKYL